MLDYYTNNFTTHGLTRVFHADHVVERVIWILGLLIGVAGMLMISREFIRAFVDGEIASDYKEKVHI